MFCDLNISRHDNWRFTVELVTVRCWVKPGLPPWGPHVRFRRVQTLVREGSPLVRLRPTRGVARGRASSAGVGAAESRTAEPAGARGASAA